MKVLTLLILSLLHFNVSAQATFIKTINDPVRNNKISVLSVNQGDFVVWISDSLKLYKFDKCGNTLWSKQYTFQGITSNCIENEIIKTKSNGFAFLTREVNTSMVSPRVTILDSNGNIIWSKSYAVANYTQCVYSLIQDKNNNFYIIGNISRIGGGTSENSILKINNSGTILWSKSYTNGGTWGQAILTSDNGLLTRKGFYLIKINSSGGVQWTSSNLTPGNYYYYAPVEMIDGYIFTSTNSRLNLINFHKISLAGNLIWTTTKTINISGRNEVLRKKSNGNFVAIFNKNAGGINYPTLIEFDKDLNVISNNSLNIQGMTATEIVFSDKNIPYLVGSINSSGTGKPFYAKLNQNYKSGCDTVFPINFTSNPNNYTNKTTTVQNNSPITNTKSGSYINFSINTNTMCSANNFNVNLGNDTIICPSSKLTIKNKSSYIFDVYSWSTGETSKSITINSAGKYWLTVTENCTGITLTDTIIVTKKNLIKPSLLISDSTICFGQFIVMDAFVPGATYLWDDNSNSNNRTIILPGKYHVDIFQQGCKERFYAEIAGCEDLKIPNVFSPNGDGINDFFKISYFGSKDYKLTIFNRWGSIIFENKDKYKYWRGKYNSNPASEGTYYYVLTIGNKHYKGYLTLVR